MINVSETELHIITAILKRFVPDCEVRIFGSRHNGVPRAYSDLDCVLAGKTRLDINIIDTIKGAFAESDLPYRVDLHDWNALSPEFRTTIERRGFEILDINN